MVHTEEFDKKALRERLELLSDKQRLAYALLVAERFWQNYLPFHRQKGWGDPALLRKILDLAWTSFFEVDLVINVDKLLERLNKMTPDSEDFSGAYAEQATSAAIIISYLASFLKTRAVADVEYLSQAAFDAVYGFVGWKLWGDQNLVMTQEMEKQQVSHPLVQEELQRQRNDIEMVSALDLNSVDAVEKLRTERAQQLESSLGLS
jgi:uncharacterized protein